METVGAWGWQGKDAAPKKFVCKFCKVEVYGRGDSKPKLGLEHKKSCPRRRNGA